MENCVDTFRNFGYVTPRKIKRDKVEIFVLETRAEVVSLLGTTVVGVEAVNANYFDPLVKQPLR